MHILTDQDIVKLLRWPDVLSVLEDAFRTRASTPDFFQVPERNAITSSRGVFLSMPGADKDGWFGVKQVAVLPDNPAKGKPSVQAWYTLFDPDGTPALACDATLLTRYRTSAVSAVAAKYLAPKHAEHLLIVGTGSLAPWMAQAHLQVHAYESVSIWGRDNDKAHVCAQAIEERFATHAVRPLIHAVTDLADAVKASDVISVATTATKPVIKGDWLRAGQHLDLVGAFVPDMVEADPDAVKRATVYVDDRDACEIEAGDLIQAVEQGWSFEHIKADLAQLVQAGNTHKQEGSSELTLFKSVGLALEDLVVARLLYEKSLEA